MLDRDFVRYELWGWIWKTLAFVAVIGFVVWGTIQALQGLERYAEKTADIVIWKLRAEQANKPKAESFEREAVIVLRNSGYVLCGRAVQPAFKGRRVVVYYKDYDIRSLPTDHPTVDAGEDLAQNDPLLIVRDPTKNLPEGRLTAFRGPATCADMVPRSFP